MIHITNPTPSQRATFLKKNRQPSVLFQNMLKGNLEVPQGGAEGFPQINATDGKTNTGWKSGPSSPTNNFATVTTLPAQLVDCLCIASHNLATVNATLRVQGFIGGSWTNISDPVAPSDNGTIMFIFPAVEVTGVRLNISAHDDAVFLGVVSAGLRLVFKPLTVLPYNPLHLSEDVEMLTNRSGNGNYLGSRVKRRGLVGSINFAVTEFEWIQRNLESFRRYYNDGGAFFFAPAPGLLQQDLIYCWREGRTLIPEFVVASHRARISMEVRGYNAR